MIGDDRGQAYTLESLIAALVLVTALLFALESVVIMPSSAGTLDRDVQAQLHQESSDLLVSAEHDDELSRQVRFWEERHCDEDGSVEWCYADSNHDPENQYEPGIGYTTDQLPVQDLGEALNHTVREGNQYNVELVYRGTGGDRQTTRLVYQGTPGDDVVTASYTVTLTDSQRVTGSNSTAPTLGTVWSNSSPDEVPIPDAYSGELYNVVEVRLVLW